MKILLPVILFLCSLSIQAQQLVNGSFDDWVWDYATPYPRPVGWECNNYKMNARAENLPVQACVIYRTGIFSAIIWNVTDTLTLKTQPAHLWQSVKLNGQRPQMLRFYARYDIASDDPASIEVEFFHSGAFMHKELLLLNGIAHLDSFEKADIPIHYTYEVAPDSAVVHIRSSVSENLSQASNLVSIDDVEFIYNNTKSIGNVFPNPASGVHYIPVEGFENTMLSIELYDVLGRLFMQKEYYVQNRFEDMPMAPLPAGTYFYRIKAGSDQYVRRAVVPGE